MKHDGNAEAGMLKEKFLDGVGEFGHAARGLAIGGRGRITARVARTTHLTETKPLFEGGLGFGKVEYTLRINQFSRFFLPDTHHLFRLFLEGHTSEQVLDTARGRKARVLVSGDDPVGLGHDKMAVLFLA